MLPSTKLIFWREFSGGTGDVALLLCELVAGLLTLIFVCCWFGSLDGNKIGDVGAVKIAEVLPSTKLTHLK